MGLLAYFAWSAPRGTTWRFSAVLGMLGAGVLGNLYDRVFEEKRRGRDFLDVYVEKGALSDQLVEWFGTNTYPTFNVADAFIVCGAILLLIAFARQPRDEGAGKAEKGAAKGK